MIPKIWLAALFWGLIASLSNPLLRAEAAQQRQPEHPPTAYESEWRTRTQQADRVLEIIGIRKGMAVGEVGAGGGYFTVKLARAVGGRGTVLANDIEPTYLEYIQERCKKAGISNVTTVLGQSDDPKFPPHELDMAIMIQVYHHLSEAVPFLESLKASLKKGATLVIVEHKLPAGQEEHARYLRGHSKHYQAVLIEAEAAGYELLRLNREIPNYNVFVFMRREDAPRPILDGP